MDKAIKTEKKFEFFLGIFFLIPPILGVLFFILNLYDLADGRIVEMRNLGGQWDWHSTDGGVSMSPAPLYLGMMAIAGVLLVKDSLRYILVKHKEDNKNETSKELSTTKENA